MLSCHSKESFGFDCPMCGFQRSVEALFNGDFTESLLLFPALIPLFITLIITIFYIRYKFKNGNKWVVGFFSLTAGLMFVNFLVKFFTAQ